MSDETGAGKLYDDRALKLRAEHESALRRWRRFANLRLGAFVLLAASAWWAIATRDQTPLFPFLAVAVTAIAFAFLVSASSRAKVLVQSFADLASIAEEGAHRVRRDWAALEQRAWPAVPASHPYAFDLDLFGNASLAQLFPAVSLAPGRTTLASWLLNPAPVAEIIARQQAIDELKWKLDFRDELVLQTMRINTNERRLQGFETWATGDASVTEATWITATTVAIPIAAAVLVVVRAAGVVGYAYWLIPLLIGVVLTWRFRKPLSAELSEVQGERNVLRGYARVASLISETTWNASLLRDISARLGAGSDAAAHRMKSLESLGDSTDVRLSPMLHFIVQTLTLWDFHVVRALGKWKRKSGHEVATWMRALGEFESVAALATLAHDNPDWIFPEIETHGPATVSAAALGHPLLDANSAVRNDVTIGPPGTLLFVTGSNMAGKSTLLRAVGLNVVLAQTGSVVCASAMRCAPVSPYTSMRVQDSLERGVSYFMAELERLKIIVDAAATAHEGATTTVLYLLDEILHGTNSAERTIAARHVLARLVKLGAIGAVTTHDLQLADATELARIATHVHFQEQFSRSADGQPSMSFDYKLRPGKAESSNALKLLELVGLGEALNGESPLA
ncbi:MAG: MutS family DNA mismatch repair protein [Gemmatimonadaceae bacterium]